MNPRLLDLLRQQHSSGYPDVAGAHASVTVPISDHLVEKIVRENIPPNVPVREVNLHAVGTNRFTIRVRLSRPPLMPPLSATLSIEQQPRLPEHPVLVLRLAVGGLLSLAASAVRFLNVLPPGITMDGDLIAVNLRTLLEQRGRGEALQFLDHLEVTAEEGRFVISARGSVPPPTPTGTR